MLPSPGRMPALYPVPSLRRGKAKGTPRENVLAVWGLSGSGFRVEGGEFTDFGIRGFAA